MGVEPIASAFPLGTTPRHIESYKTIQKMARVSSA